MDRYTKKQKMDEFELLFMKQDDLIQECKKFAQNKNEQIYIETIEFHLKQAQKHISYLLSTEVYE